MDKINSLPKFDSSWNDLLQGKTLFKPRSKDEGTVMGKVTNQLEIPQMNVMVRAYDKDMRETELLGECQTDKLGNYKIEYNHSHAPKEEQNINLMMRVYSVPGDTMIYETEIENIRFDALQDETFDIVISNKRILEEVEYDKILALTNTSLQRVKISELQESKKQRDITYLTKETYESADKFEHLVVSYRLAELTTADPDFFYALLRMNSVLKNDFTTNYQARISIDINSAPLPIAYDIALLDPKQVQKDIESAIKKKIVNESVTKDLQKNIRIMTKYKNDAEKYYQEEHPKKVIEMVSSFLLSGKLGKVQKMFEENKDDLPSLLQKLRDGSLFQNDIKFSNAKATLAIGEILGFNDKIIETVKDDHNIKSEEDVSKLAKYNKTEWKAVLEKSAKGSNTIDPKMIDIHSSILARKFEKMYPQVAFVSQIEREKKSKLVHFDEIKNLLTKNPEFDLGATKIDLFAKANKLNTEKNASMLRELKSVQRMYKLTEHYSKTHALLDNGINSSSAISNMGVDRFVKEIAPKVGMSTKEAKIVFSKAQKTATAAMLIAGELQDTTKALNLPVFEIKSTSKKLEAVTKDFPNLQTLFKGIDMYDCEHCRSVYSPAAYLVEILEFINSRSVTDLTLMPHVTSNFGRDVLFERRPDIGEIDLGCENAETPLPYIDLVCEILEEAVAPDAGFTYNGVLSDGPDPLVGKISASLLAALVAKGIPVTENAMVYHTEALSGPTDQKPHYVRDIQAVCKIEYISPSKYNVKQLHQTLQTEEELAAAPEYVNQDAYDELKNKTYAFTLPFDLNHKEALSYLARFDIARDDLMKEFQIAGNPDDNSIAAEKLGLTDAERLIIIADGSANQQDFWNTTTSNASDEMKVVDTFLTKTGISYKDLMLLLTLDYIDPTDNLFIKHLDLTSDTKMKEIANLDDTDLDRIHRFLRLQKKTKIDFLTLNEVITQGNLGNSKLDNDTLKVLASLINLSEVSGFKLVELIGMFGEIPYVKNLEDSPIPLYQQIFLNKSQNGVIDDAFLPEKVVGTGLLSAHKNYLSTALKVSLSDLDKLLSKLLDDKLSFDNLSTLYVLAKIIKKQKLKSDDFVILQDLTGNNLSTPNEIIDFLSLLAVVRKLPLKIADLKFMLWHEATNLTDREMKEEKIISILQSIQSSLQSAYTADKSMFDENMTADEQKENLSTVLSKLPGVLDTDVKMIIGFVDRVWTTPANANLFIDTLLGNLFDTTNIQSALTTMSTANAATLETKRNLFVKSLLDTIAVYNFETDKKNLLTTIVSTSFKASPELTEVILKFAKLGQPLPGTAMISEILLSDSLIDKVNPVPVLPAITSAAFADQFSSLRLLFKMIPLVNSFKLELPRVQFVLKNAGALGWFEFDHIPYKSGQTKVDLLEFINFAKFMWLGVDLTPVENPIDAENPVTFEGVLAMLLPTATTTQAQWIDAFSLLNSYDKDTFTDLDAYLFTTFDLTKYSRSDLWEKIQVLMGRLTILGSTVAQVSSYIKPILTGNDTLQIRTALKSRYDEELWLDTLKQISDVLRPQKRDALVAYLLAVNPEMKDVNYLYDYFLVDSQMEAVMNSSRIVLAHGSVQLFVQRCLMGLEPKAAADVDNDKSWDQWKWMKNYRVWEANRKVFLYPENWIEAELRDDKSFQFQELENELLQNEINDDTAEELITTYLEKLDTIAFLEVVATWYQSDIYTMHVFARTKGGDPATYYYRKLESERSWSPWEKVDLDLTGGHLLAFERNNRLCLAWLVFNEISNPDQTGTVPNPAPGTKAPLDKPMKKLQIQLAVSEFANKKWQQKKVSVDYMLTPSSWTTDTLSKNNYNMMYLEATQQVMIFSTEYSGGEYHQLNGVYNLTGCKGYPELSYQGNSYFPDFFPDFKDAAVLSERYRELNVEPGDELSERNGLSLFTFFDLLMKTPGNFRITFPLQFTKIDMVALLFQYFMMSSYYGSEFTSVASDRYRRFKLPLGTLLPYFDEDSVHNYVVIPGFYEREGKKEGPNGEVVNVTTPQIKRTASDVMKLIEAIVNLFNKYLAIYQADPAHDLTKLFAELVADDDYIKIIAEIKIYLKLRYGEQFKNNYHPLICSLRKTLYKDGVKQLMKRETQLQVTPFSFDVNYQPTALVPKLHPIEDIDFASDGSYAGYNWELFFHVPFLLGTTLTANQRFEESSKWFHYIFNPTGALSGNAPQKYWVTKPFFLTLDSEYMAERIDKLLYRIADPTSPDRVDLEFAIDQWREKPFKPHVIARFRPVAYQKAMLIKYLDNLIQWGDFLFRQDSMESIVQATQMYILADKLLGPKPRTIPNPIKQPLETYNQLKAKLDSFGNALVDLENILPDLSVLPEGGAELPPGPITLAMLYFCVPINDKMLEYWDTIADRLFKIRNSENIDGVFRSLALFSPPIDPGMLVRAAASGLDISSIINGLSAPAPFYRFATLSQKATELASEVRFLGSSLLSVLEKKDAEGLTRLRSQLEIKVMTSIADTKKLQIEEAKAQIEVLNKTKAITDERNQYYSAIEKISANEQLNMDKLDQAVGWQTASNIAYTLGAGLALIPDFALGVSGFGGSPHGAAKLGGSALAHSTDAIGKGLSIFSTIASFEAGRAATLGNFERRYSDWKLQERLAKRELESIDKQIAAANIRTSILESDLKDYMLSIDASKQADAFMKSKFTNQELYNWMVGQVNSVYYKAYKLAHDLAKKSERCYQFELGNGDTFINYGYWDSMKKGLQSADQLTYDIKRMESSYLEKNKREYEINKLVSLFKLDPLAIIKLRQTGSCDFVIPEALYDLDHPGQYFRRLKSVSVSLPCIAGPYTSVSAKLSLVSNKYRKNTAKAQGAGTPKEEYEEDLAGDDRFVYNVGSIQSIATSHAQNDSGMFELNFRDDRYLPFEGTGAISTWRLELADENRQFDYDTISDVILHVNYTSREGGSTLKNLASSTLKSKLDEIKEQLSETGLHVALNVKHDMPNEWYKLLKTGAVDLTIDTARLPYFAQNSTAAIDSVMFLARVKGNLSTYSFKIDGANRNLARNDEWKLCRVDDNTLTIDTPFTLSMTPTELSKLDDLMIVVKYTF